MTGVPDTPAFNATDADGINTVFNFSFFVYADDDIKVYSVLNDVETPITSGITKAIASTFIGGTVTFSVAPLDAVGDILIRREVDYEQTTEFATVTRFKETAIETALNNLCLQIQQLRSNSALSLQYSEVSGVTDAVIGTPVAGTLLGFSGTTGRISSVLLASISTELDVLFTGLVAEDFIKYDGAQWVNRTPTEVKTDLGLVIGTDIQAYDAGLLSIAGLTTAANKMVYTTASDVYATTDLTAFARTILDDADALAVKTTLGITLIQQDSASTATYSDNTDPIPYDDTIPQLSSEGTSLLSLAVTPLSASSTIIIRAVIPCDVATATKAMAALYVDSTENAVAIAFSKPTGGGGGDMLELYYEVASASTTARTYKLYVGPDTTGNMYVNGSSSNRIGAGISKAYLTMQEII